MVFAQLIDAAPDGGYYFCGQYNLDIVAGKIDSSGNLEWAKQIGQTYLRDIPVDMTVLDNGNAVIAMWSDSGAASSSIKTNVLCFDNNGNNVFTKKFVSTLSGSNYYYPNNIIKDGNGFSISINNSNSEVRLLKLDSIGNKLNSMYISQGLLSLFKTSSGDYLLNGIFSLLLSRLSSSFVYIGSDQFVLTVDPTYYGILELSGGSYMLYGSISNSCAFVCKINHQLQYQWAYIYSLPNPSPVLGKTGFGHQVDNNSVIFLGGGEDGTIGKRYPYFLRIDTLGNVQQFKLIQKIGLNVDLQVNKSVYRNGIITFIHNERASITQPVNSFYISSIDTTFLPLCNAHDSAYIVDLDPFMQGGTYTIPSGITNDSLAADTLPITTISFSYGDCNDSTLFVTQIKTQKENFNIFPNPTNNFITIHYNVFSPKESTVSLFNLYGQPLTPEGEPFRTSEKEMKIDMRNFPAGIYFVKLRVDGKDEVSKVVKYE